jgi:DNA-directed RNA polymerase specialized sigma24 family protein
VIVFSAPDSRACGIKKRSERGVVGDVGSSAPEEGTASIASLGRVYQRRYPRFLRVAEAIVGDPDLAHDVVQDAFARAIRSRFDFRGEGTIEGWVWQTVVNAARNARRDRPAGHVPLEEVAGEAASGNGRPP